MILFYIEDIDFLSYVFQVCVEFPSQKNLVLTPVRNMCQEAVALFVLALAPM